MNLFSRFRRAAAPPPDAERDAASAAMDRYASGDDAAFGDVYDLLAPRLHGYLVRQVRDRARAEDLVQQTFLHMHRARGSFVPGADVVPWAFAIARRLLIDGHRRSAQEQRWRSEQGRGEAHTADSPDAFAQARQLAARVQEELEKLPEPQRVAFELVRQDGLSLADAAGVLGISVNAVKLRLHRAYEALRQVAGGEALDLEQGGV